MINISFLQKYYGDRKVLDVDFLSVKKGETVVIVGPNGSGKSTLLKILAGITEKTSGEVASSGEIYYLPQQSIPFRKTVKENIQFSVKDEKNKVYDCDEIISELSLSHLADKNAKGLSGGECQRLALARLLINKADFILLDEPSSAADIEGTDVINKAIINYKEKTGCGILMTTHSPRQAMELADRVIMLCDGRIIEQGSPTELLSSPETEWGKKFIAMWKIDS